VEFPRSVDAEVDLLLDVCSPAGAGDVDDVGCTSEIAFRLCEPVHLRPEDLIDREQRDVDEGNERCHAGSPGPGSDDDRPGLGKGGFSPGESITNVEIVGLMIAAPYCIHGHDAGHGLTAGIGERSDCAGYGELSLIPGDESSGPVGCNDLVERRCDPVGVNLSGPV